MLGCIRTRAVVPLHQPCAVWTHGWQQPTINMYELHGPYHDTAGLTVQASGSVLATKEATRVRLLSTMPVFTIGAAVIVVELAPRIWGRAARVAPSISRRRDGKRRGIDVSTFLAIIGALVSRNRGYGAVASTNVMAVAVAGPIGKALLARRYATANGVATVEVVQLRLGSNALVYGIRQASPRA